MQHNAAIQLTNEDTIMKTLKDFSTGLTTFGNNDKAQRELGQALIRFAGKCYIADRNCSPMQQLINKLASMQNKATRVQTMVSYIQANCNMIIEKNKDTGKYHCRCPKGEGKELVATFNGKWWEHDSAGGRIVLADGKAEVLSLVKSLQKRAESGSVKPGHEALVAEAIAKLQQVAAELPTIVPATAAQPVAVAVA